MKKCFFYLTRVILKWQLQLEVSLDGRTFSLFGRTYGRKLSSFSFSRLITDENYMFSGHRCGRKFFDFYKIKFLNLLCLLRNHWNTKENIFFCCMANLGFFGRNDKRKVIVAFSFSAVPMKTKIISKIFCQTKNDRLFVQA